MWKRGIEVILRDHSFINQKIREKWCKYDTVLSNHKFSVANQMMHFYGYHIYNLFKLIQADE